ncbi:MAG: sigma-70 family RNA polymerase sigma factor [Candidatus Krumholzibacteriia bacterium]
MEIAELLQRCRDGDELAWEALVREHQARVYAVALGYTGAVDEARDLAQEIFVRVFRKLHTCEDPDRFVSWLLRIARNAGIDHLRRRRARPPRQDIPAEEMVDLVHRGPDPEEEFLRDRRKRLVLRALQTLSKINKEIVLLKDIQGLPLEEIARILDLPLGTVKSRSSRARVELARAVLAMQQGGGTGRDGLDAGVEVAW